VRLLYVCHQVPYPPNKGEKIRAFHHLTYLARRHRVHVACLAGSHADLAEAAHLKARCASVDAVYHSPRVGRLRAAAALPTGRSLSLAAYDSPELRARIARRIEVEQPDLLVAYSAPMAPYIERFGGIPRVIDFVDADSEKVRAYASERSFPGSALYALEAKRLARSEGKMASWADLSIFISEAEAEIVRPRARGRNMAVIPNGVDLDAFRPRANGSKRGRPVIVFVGVMSYYPNADAVLYFARDIYPIVRSKVPDAELVIVGRDPIQAVRRLEEHPGVRVTGTVPDVRPYLAEAAVAVAPFRIARGIQNKVLEAMASGLPVIGTSLAFQGLAAGTADGIRTQDSPRDFADELVAVLSNPTLREDLGRQGRAYVERNHRWEAVGELLERALLGVLESHPVGAGREL
jgi:sugar transferase (PEP-CTERM/EpsH1 system associated)